MKTNEIAIIDFGFGLEDELNDDICFGSDTNTNTNTNSVEGCSCTCSCDNRQWWQFWLFL